MLSVCTPRPFQERGSYTELGTKKKKIKDKCRGDRPVAPTYEDCPYALKIRAIPVIRDSDITVHMPVHQCL